MPQWPACRVSVASHADPAACPRLCCRHVPGHVRAGYPLRIPRFPATRAHNEKDPRRLGRACRGRLSRPQWHRLVSRHALRRKRGRTARRVGRRRTHSRHPRSQRVLLLPLGKGRLAALRRAARHPAALAVRHRQGPAILPSRPAVERVARRHAARAGRSRQARARGDERHDAADALSWAEPGITSPRAAMR